MTSSQDLCRVLSCLDLKQFQVHRLVDTIVKWESSCGKEWTVDRLKDLHRFYLFKEAGTLDDFKPSSWLKFDNRGIRGPFSVLNGKSIKTQLFATRVYTLFQLDSPSLRQLSKFRNAAFQRRKEPITRNNIIVTSDEVHKVYHFVKPNRKWKIKSGSINAVENFRLSKTKRAPLGQYGTCNQSDIETWLEHDLANPFIRSIVRDHKVLAAETGLLSAVYDECIPALEEKYAHREYLSRKGIDISIGRLGYIQEPGCKLRVVANPAMLLQVLLNPLKKTLSHILKNDDSVSAADCTFDQDKGATFALESLKQGKTVYSIDLSNATDSFPLRYTIGVLCDFLDMSDPLSIDAVKAFARCSHRSWYDPVSESCESWKKGQPLGLGPSFFAFALSHHSVVRSLEDALGKEPCSTYRVLGDDIVINDSDVAGAYVHYLTERLGCEVSMSKTLTSNKVAEFAGKVISGESMIQLCKYRTMSDRNFVEIARQLGPKSVGLMRPRQRKVIKEIQEVPEFFGGLGWNPNGIPIEDRISKGIELGFLDIRPETKEVINPLIPYRRLSNQIFYSTGISLDRSNMIRQRPIVASDLEALTEVGDIINTSVGVEQDVREKSNWPSPSVSGDPRGNRSTLETLEARIKPKRLGPKL